MKQLNVNSMLLSTILQEFIPSNEIKMRIKNGQIKINNEKITNKNLELDIQDGYWELGEFLFANMTERFMIIPFFKIGIDIKNFFGYEPTNIKLLEFLTGYTLVSISKNHHYVFINI